MAKFLDSSGLTALWARIKQYVYATSSTNGTYQDVSLTVGSVTATIPNRTSQLTDNVGYVTGFSTNGTTVTYTKGNGASGTFSTQDTKVTQTVTTTSNDYPLLFKNTTSTSTATDSTRFGSGIKANPSTSTITATGFAGIATTSNSLTKVTCTVSGDRYDKNVTLPGFSLCRGATLIVAFANENTAANPRLNVNGTGEKKIYAEGVEVTEGGYPKAREYTAVYDGTAWQLTTSILTEKAGLSSPTFTGTVTAPVFSGRLNGNATSATTTTNALSINGVITSSTAASTQTKVADLEGFTLCKGAQVTIKFAYANTAASPKLNINSTGAKDIRVDGKVIEASSNIPAANTEYVATYSGSQWHLRSLCSIDSTPNSNSASFVTSGGIYTALVAKADKASPTFTGTPTAPTASAGTSTTQIATTAFVANAVSTAMSSVAGALVYKGTIIDQSSLLGTALSKGWYYIVNATSLIIGVNTGSSPKYVTCETGDMVIVKTAGTYANSDTGKKSLVDAIDVIQSNMEAIPVSDIENLSLT